MPNNKRIILHIDFNSYFASVEQQANPFLRGKAIGVGGKPGTRSIITTASIKAKQRGVKTAMPSSKAMNILPDLEIISGDSAKYQDTTEKFLNICRRYSDTIEQFSIDEAFLDITNRCEDWMDAIATALRIRDCIKKEIGPYTTASIGIAQNKLVAKIASESDKPNGVTIVYPDEVEAFLDNCNLSDIPGIGQSILRHLKEMGISEVSQLRKATMQELSCFKQYGNFLYNAVRGIDDSPVNNQVTQPKSVGHSYTLQSDTNSPAILRATLIRLSDKVAWRLRSNRLVASRLSCIARFNDMKSFTSTIKFDAPTNDGLKIFNEAWGRINSLLDDNKIRLIGVIALDLVKAHEQISYDAVENQRVKLLPSLDAIQKRYGNRSWIRASELFTTKLSDHPNGFIKSLTEKSKNT